MDEPDPDNDDINLQCLDDLMEEETPTMQLLDTRMSMDGHEPSNYGVKMECLNQPMEEEAPSTIQLLDMTPNSAVVDCSDAFNTDRIFPCRDDLLDWVRNVAKDNGFVIVILKSGNGIKTFVTLGCERSGTYRYQNKKLVRQYPSSRKCDCPFRLKGRPVKKCGGWRLILICGYHNHSRAETLASHPYPCRLSVDEKAELATLTKNMIKPSDILLMMKTNNAKSATTIKHIYNAGYAYRKAQRESRTEMQQLVEILEKSDYVHWHRKVADKDIVRDIFWIHPDAINLLNAFSVALVVDSTYKTNKYRLPLLEIVGITSTGMTYSVAFAYMESKRVDNFVWVLEKLRSLILKEDALPQVIVTNRDLALINAVEDVFSSSSHLLCQFHITKVVSAKCKLMVKPIENCEHLMDVWKCLIYSLSDAEYAKNLKVFETVCSEWPEFLEYVNTWFIPYKQKFVSAWLNRVMHLGNITTNRVEGAHGKFKRMLQNSVGDLVSCWNTVADLLQLHYTEIRASFEDNIATIEDRVDEKFYAVVKSVTTRYALDLIAEECDRVTVVGIDSNACGCVLRSTHGLPCACELARYSTGNYIIPLTAIHSHWKILSLSNQCKCEPWEVLGLQTEFDAIQRRWRTLDLVGKVKLKCQLRELAYPEPDPMFPPSANS